MSNDPVVAIGHRSSGDAERQNAIECLLGRFVGFEREDFSIHDLFDDLCHDWSYATDVPIAEVRHGCGTEAARRRLRGATRAPTHSRRAARKRCGRFVQRAMPHAIAQAALGPETWGTSASSMVG